MEKKKLTLVKNIILATLGTLIAAVGIRLIVLSQTGADALSTFILGVMAHFDVQFGTVSLTINILILILVFFTNRKLIGLASVINAFGLGIFLNGFDALGILQKIPAGSEYPVVIAGTLLFGFGTALYLITKTGSGPYEFLMQMVQKRFNWPVSSSRIMLDGSFMLIGFLLGGTVGFGTIIVLVLLGPSLDFFLKYLTKLTAKKPVTASTNS